MSQQEIQDERNKMWRNGCINDTYEPGSTFKIITASAALEEGVVTPEDTFSCPGFRIVDDRRIRCHKTTGHGSETFVQGVMNSCNPVFIEVGQRLGTDAFYRYFQQFGLLERLGLIFRERQGRSCIRKGYRSGGTGQRSRLDSPFRSRRSSSSRRRPPS